MEGGIDIHIDSDSSEESGINSILLSNPLLLEAAISDIKKGVETLEGILRAGNIETNKVLEQFGITVHGLKSVLGNVGEMKLSDWALQLEGASHEKNFSKITSIMPNFLKGLRVFLSTLEIQFEVQMGSGGTNEDPMDLREKLIFIYNACTDYDRKEALELLDQIKNCSKNTRGVLDKIKRHVLHSEFEEAAEVAETYLKDL
jgi:HPt (histidine-containing phosphotransfer) domain-containing protein